MRRGSPNSIGRSSRWRTGTFFLSQARTSRWKASSSGVYDRSMTEVGSTFRARHATVVLFTRDLRVHDHPALVAACRAGAPVLPLFVLDDAILNGPFAAPNRVRFLL